MAAAVLVESPVSPAGPVPATAATRLVLASQKSRWASMAAVRRGNALPRLGEQREDVDLHGVVAQQRFVRDDLAERQDLALVMRRDVVGRAIDAVGIARFGAHDDRLVGQAVDRLPYRFARRPGREPHRNRTAEFGNRPRCRRWRTGRRLAGPLVFRYARHLQQIDEARRIGQPVGLGQRIDLDPRDLQIDAAARSLLSRPRAVPAVGLGSGGSALASWKFRSLPHSPSSADQSLAFAFGALARDADLRREIGVEHLIARLIELVHGAGFAEALASCVADSAAACACARKRPLLMCGDRAIPGAARFDRDACRFPDGAQLRLTKTFRRDFGARRQRRKRQEYRQ